MRMVATGQGQLYRDCFFIHPPGVIYAGAWVWSLVQGNLFAVRLASILFCSLTMLPLYTLARQWFGARVALVSLLLFAVSPGFGGWLGQAVFLEQPLNVFLYFALWLLLGRYRQSLWSTTLAGCVMGIAFLVKETASLATVACIIAWLSALKTPLGEKSPERCLSLRQLFLFGLAWAVTLGGLVALLAAIPNYMRDTVILNAKDPFNLRSRYYEFQNGLFQLPFQLTFGLVGLWLMQRNRTDRVERFLGMYGVLSLLLVFVAPKRLFWRHFITIMPLCGIGVALCWERLYREPMTGKRRAVMRGGATFCALISLLTLSLYHFSERRILASHLAALHLLQTHEGVLFTLDPIWAVSAGKALPKWQYSCDATFAIPFGLTNSEEFTAVARSCPLVLLNDKTMEVLPDATLVMIRKEYRSLLREGEPNSRAYIEVLERK